MQRRALQGFTKATLPVVRDILSLVPTLSSATELATVRTAAVVVDESARSFFVENCLFSTISMSTALNQLGINHHTCYGFVTPTSLQFQQNIPIPAPVVAHAWIEIDGKRTDLASNTLPFRQLLMTREIDVQHGGDESNAQALALFNELGLSPKDLETVKSSPQDFSIEVYGNAISVGDSNIEYHLRNHISRSDVAALGSPNIGPPLSVFEYALSNREEYIENMPDKLKELYDQIIRRAVEEDNLDF